MQGAHSDREPCAVVIAAMTDRSLPAPLLRASISPKGADTKRRSCVRSRRDEAQESVRGASDRRADFCVRSAESGSPPHDQERGRQLCQFLCQVRLVLIPLLAQASYHGSVIQSHKAIPRNTLRNASR